MKKKVIIFILVLLVFIPISANQKEIKIMANFEDVTHTVKMDKPPFSYYLSDQVNYKKNHSIKLKMKSSKPNNITDDEEWFQKNKLLMNTYEVPNPYSNSLGNLPDGIEANWKDLMITAAFYDKNYIYCTYGSNFAEGYILNIYDAKSLEMIYSMDFSDYRYSPSYVKTDYEFIQQKINWAQIKDNILYISHSHDTYAKSSKGMNAYITAIDLKDMSILWRTKALVSNAANFVIVNDIILCGYGFTAESDYLYQVDKCTGKVLNKITLKSGPTYIINKGKSIYVRTYNMDYKFDIVS